MCSSRREWRTWSASRQLLDFFGVFLVFSDMILPFTECVSRDFGFFCNVSGALPNFPHSAGQQGVSGGVWTQTTARNSKKTVGNGFLSGENPYRIR